MGLEGAVYKRRHRPYSPQKNGDWLKLKSVQREEFVVGGYADSTASPRAIGALHVGYFDESGGLRYAGRVGSGFTFKMHEDLRKRLKALDQAASPFLKVPKGHAGRETHWVQPALVAHVGFSGWTSDRLLRHPRFQGLSEDRSAAEITPEEAGSPGSPAKRGASAKKRVEPVQRTLSAKELEAVKSVKFTNPERILYPEIGLTKIQLAGF